MTQESLEAARATRAVESSPAAAPARPGSFAGSVFRLQSQLGNQAVCRLLHAGGTGVEGPARPRIDRHVEAMMDEDVEEVRAALSQSWVDDDDEAKALRRVAKWARIDEHYEVTTGYPGTDHLDRFLLKLKMRTFTVSTVRTGWIDEWTNAYDLLWHELEDDRKATLSELVARSRRQATVGPGSERLENIGSFMGKREAAAAFGIGRAGGTMLGGLADTALSMAGVKSDVAGYLGKQFDETADIILPKEVLAERLDFGLFRMGAYEFGATAGKVPYGLAIGAATGKAGVLGRALAVGQVVQSAEQLGEQLATLRRQGRSWRAIAQDPEVWVQVVGVVAGAVGAGGSTSQALQKLGMALTLSQTALLVAAYRAVDADTTLADDERDRRKAEILADAASGALSAVDARYGDRFKRAWETHLTAATPAEPPAALGDGPRHRGATAEGTGAEFSYEYHPPAAEPTVETRRAAAGPRAPERRPKGYLSRLGESLRARALAAAMRGLGEAGPATKGTGAAPFARASGEVEVAAPASPESVRIRPAVIRRKPEQPGPSTAESAPVRTPAPEEAPKGFETDEIRQSMNEDEQRWASHDDRWHDPGGEGGLEINESPTPAQRRGRSSPSEEMAEAMAQEGNLRPPGHATHHIVADADPRADTARRILRKADIEPRNDPRNGIHLPQNAGNVKTVPEAITQHSTLHTESYYDTVNERLIDAYRGTGPYRESPILDPKTRVETELAKLYEEIAGGGLPHPRVGNR